MYLLWMSKPVIWINLCKKRSRFEPRVRLAISQWNSIKYSLICLKRHRKIRIRKAHTREVLRLHAAQQSKIGKPQKAHIAWTLTWAASWAKDHQLRSSMPSLDAKWNKCYIRGKIVKISSRSNKNNYLSRPLLQPNTRSLPTDRRHLRLKRDLLGVSSHNWQRRRLAIFSLRKTTRRPSIVLTNCSYRKVMVPKKLNKKLRESKLMSKKLERLKRSSKR